MKLWSEKSPWDAGMPMSPVAMEIWLPAPQPLDDNADALVVPATKTDRGSAPELSIIALTFCGVPLVSFRQYTPEPETWLTT
jgi:hypothetical protein